ncbi:Uncharacterized protein FWK35_00005279, partial [Aphis craccivora]
VGKPESAVRQHTPPMRDWMGKALYPKSITSRNNAPISNFGGGFQCKSEHPWCIIESIDH